jgi:hypothetical protein
MEFRDLSSGLAENAAVLSQNLRSIDMVFHPSTISSSYTCADQGNLPFGVSSLRLVRSAFQMCLAGPGVLLLTTLGELLTILLELIGKFFFRRICECKRLCI